VRVANGDLLPADFRFCNWAGIGGVLAMPHGVASGLKSRGFAGFFRGGRMINELTPSLQHI
jgi:hypothetical protein